MGEEKQAYPADLMVGAWDEMLEGFALHEIICDDAGKPCDYRFLAANPAFGRLTGLDCDQVIGCTARELIPGLEDAWVQRYGEVALGGGPTNFEMGVESIGRTYSVRAYSPRRGAFATIFTDITDVVLARDEALRERALLARAEEIGQSGSWRVDLASGSVTWSGGMHALFGIDKEAFGGDAESHLSVTHPDDRQALEETSRRVLETKVPERVEYRIIRPDGVTRRVRGEAEAERGASGEVVALSGFYRDVTDEVAMQRARELSEARYTAAFMTSPDAIVIAQLSDGLYVDVNDGFAALTGYSREDALGGDSVSLGLWVDLADRDAFIAAIVRDGYVDNYEAAFRRKDGTHIVGLTSARIIVVADEPCMLTVTRDITELVEANERMERLLKSITEVMGRVIEIRDPYTKGHEERVAVIARAIATDMGVSADEVDGIEIAALVHDIGKLSVPIEILNNPGSLSEVEFEIVKGHSRTGHDILKDIDFSWPVATMVLQHHERMDGSGYPQGLSGDEILLAARILAVADVLEAMASHRPYRPALGLAAAIEELDSNPALFDADVVASCMRLCEQGAIEL